jgi:cobyrinic acid a,c-diamide synthase
MKRVMIAGTHGGCGKSGITCAVVQALVNRKTEITVFKNGPSYIDPAFYKYAMQVKAYNLDTYLMTKNTVNYLLSKHGSELSIIAGSLGYYDGYSFTRTASCCELSLWTETPVILVVNGDGMGASIGAVIKGYI